MVDFPEVTHAVVAWHGCACRFRKTSDRRSYELPSAAYARSAARRIFVQRTRLCSCWSICAVSGVKASIHHKRSCR